MMCTVSDNAFNVCTFESVYYCGSFDVARTKVSGMLRN